MNVRALLLVFTALPAQAAEPPPLKHNPFTRPPSRVVVEVPRDATQRWTGELVVTATIVSSGGRSARVAGRVLEEGDEIHGYRLVRVHEDRAVFERNGDRQTVYVKPDREQDDEDDS